MESQKFIGGGNLRSMESANHREGRSIFIGLSEQEGVGPYTG